MTYAGNQSPLAGARDALVDEILQERAHHYAAQHENGLTSGLLEHLYYGFRHHYDHKPDYRDLIDSFAAVRLMDAAAAPPKECAS
jgi:hypothetical protein